MKQIEEYIKNRILELEKTEPKNHVERVEKACQLNELLRLQIFMIKL